MIFWIFQQDNVRNMFLYAVALIGAILFAIMTHEVAHGYVAKLNGDPTAQMSGRLNFNPSKHFDFFGLLMMLLAGFGWAKPVPINPRNFKNYKKGMLTVSLAGVTANLILAIISLGLLVLLSIIMGNSVSGDGLGSIVYFLFGNFFVLSITINITLMFFNLLPIFPLDGFRVVETLTKPNNAFVTFMRKYGIYVLLGLILFGRFFGSISIYLNPIGLYLSTMYGLAEKLIVWALTL